METPAKANTFVNRLLDVEPQYRAGIVAIPDSGERDVLRQLAKGPVWDGNLCSKSGRSELCRRGWAFSFQGWNFISLDGVAVVDALWGIKNFLTA
jgi:hypothetical protein